MLEPSPLAKVNATWRVLVTLRAFLMRGTSLFADIPLPVGMLAVVPIGESIREWFASNKF